MVDLAVLVYAYLLGAVPFAFIVARRFGGIDVRTVGSRNVGAANVLRATRLRTALLVTLLDVSKGAASVWGARAMGASEVGCAAAGVAAVVGHVYPVWLRFYGGKGVATAVGAFAVLAPWAALAAVAVFLGLVWWTRIVSVGSLAAVFLLPAVAWLSGSSRAITLAAAATGGLVVFKHGPNIARLRAGTERRLGQRE